MMANQRRVSSRGTTENDPVERSLGLVGPKWTLLIIRDLLSGPRRFTEIERSLRRANPKMITARLRELEQTGLVSRKAYAEVPPRVEYALTERGRALRPVIDALREWGEPLTAQRRE
jgi:DNA-binding HxlR family transcriptional regulator